MGFISSTVLQYINRVIPARERCKLLLGLADFSCFNFTWHYSYRYGTKLYLDTSIYSEDIHV